MDKRMEALKPEAPCCVYDLKIMIFVRLYSANLNKFTAITQIPRVKSLFYSTPTSVSLECFSLTLSERSLERRINPLFYFS